MFHTNTNFLLPINILAFYLHVCINQNVKWFSKSFANNNIFTAVLTSQGIWKSIGDTRKGIKKNDINVM